MCQVGAAALCSQINAGAGGHTWGHKLSMPGAGSLLTADLIITSHASQVPATLGLARSCHVTPRQVTPNTGDWRQSTELRPAAGWRLCGGRPHLPPGRCWPPGPGCGRAVVQTARPGQAEEECGTAAPPPSRGEDGVILEMVLAPPTPGDSKTLTEHQPMALLLHTIF